MRDEASSHNFANQCGKIRGHNTHALSEVLVQLLPVLSKGNQPRNSTATQLHAKQRLSELSLPSSKAIHVDEINFAHIHAHTGLGGSKNLLCHFLVQSNFLSGMIQ